MFDGTKIAFAAAAIALAVAPVATSAQNSGGIVQVAYSGAKAVGAGTARTFVTTKSGKLDAVGVRLSASALQNLPKGETEFAVALPHAPGLIFKTIVVNWNPHGHGPAHVYDVPHFDVHMYLIDEAARMKVAPNASKAVSRPDAAHVPAGFITDGEVVPMMGLHYVDRAAPEFHGTPFTVTPIYGYDAGKLAFVESMLTTAYLKSKPNLSRPFPQPAKVALHGLYPSTYQVRYKKATDDYVISFADFRSR
jgi:hypothetical protein